MHNDQVTGLLIWQKKMKELKGGQMDLPVQAIELLEEGRITIDTHPDFIKGLATRALMDFAVTIYNADWLIIENSTDQPFITSDNPVAYFDRGIVRETIRYIPISPRLCLRITFDAGDAPQRRYTPEEMEELIQGPPKGNVSRTSFTKLGVKHINKVVVQCAEDLVFSPNQSSGIEALVQKYSRWRIEMDYVEIPNEDENSLIQGSIMSVREIENAAANNG